ncbi:hypothetical protein Hypma_007453 [Hypsizygus marmoreus]|uniref:Serine hydrolase domain-containing protein n=1 Tax=Hypsizygus marmoreus TaxID=39966 RepID=A0A369K0J2_HYPMA|nr:hypothetical protein Hypma_007453 [Hypsizygus marmoreus]
MTNKYQLGALRKECAKDNIELVFVDAPHILQPVDLVGTSSASFGAPEAANAEADPALTPRAWWKVNRDKTMAYGLQESIESIRDVLQTRKFDGVFGFSQGAAFAAIISALLEKPDVVPSFLVDGEPPHAPFEFCVAVSGFRLRDAFVNPLFDDSYSTPTLHVIGKTDIIVVEERSRQLVDASRNKRIEEHDGGHFVPSKGNWRKFLRDYMKFPLVDHISPGLAANSSVPNSGTATPTGNEPIMMMKL